MKTSIKIILILSFGAFFALGGTFLYAYVTLTRDAPEITKVADYQPLGVTQIISVDKTQSKIMAEFYKERRYLVAYEQIPRNLINAFLSAEDSTFFEHQGVNFFAILRAALMNFLAGQVVQGGSTITQQISKSLYLNPDRSLVRKAKELFIAFQLEKNLSKEDILYLYLNQIYLGSGAYGVAAAAKIYFHKELKKLTLAEMAMIAGLPTAPGKYSPLLNPKKAKERQLYVLKRMRENKYITEDEQKAAGQEKIKIYINDGTDVHLAPHFVEHIRRYLAQKYGEKALYEDGLTVIVPAAARYYENATEALQAGLEDFDQRKGYRGPVRNIPQDQWESRKEEFKKELTKELFPFRYLTKEGSLNLEEAVADYDPTYEKSLIGKKIKAIVTEVNSEKKAAQVHVGLVQVQIPFEQVKWAYPVGSPAQVPKTISDVLHEGDEVWIKTTSRSAVEGWKGRLIQIPEVEGALYSVDIQTGQLLAMVGGYDFGRSQFNRAVQAKRQIGSTFKPIIYSAAVERGYTPASIIVDSPISFDDGQNGVWKPENYEEKFYGDTTFRQALIDSRNVPTIKIVQDIKVQTVIRQAKRLGLSGPFNSDLSISLGSANASLQEMVHAFTAFPMQGRTFQEVLYEKILDRDGRVLETTKDFANSRKTEEPQTEDATAQFSPVLPGLRLDPRVAYLMTYLMKEVIKYGTGMRANALPFSVAGKTGTTQDFRDAWFMGFSPRVVTGVWMGYDDQRSLGHGETGASAALPIWIRYMQNTLKNFPEEEFVVPEGISFVNIDPKTGKRKEAGIREAFISGTEPGAPAKTEEIKEEAERINESKDSHTIDHTDDENLREDN